MPSDAAPADWIVLKFGGTSVSRRTRWDTIGRLMRERHEKDHARVLVVVSALSGVTNELQAICDHHADAAEVGRRIDTLVERHRSYCGDLSINADAVLGPRFAALRALGEDSRRVAGSLDWQAEVMAQGELLSSTLGVAYLRAQGLAVDWLDARDWLNAQTLPNQNEWSRRLSVSCSYQGDAGLRERFNNGNGELLITQGFIARAPDGGTAILGRGGSDTSAAYFGALLGARRVEIWTDVPGMFSANPRVVPDARLLWRLDYEEAQEIATTGAKVLHPRCIHPCREARVPIWIRDTERPEMAGTVIDHRATTVPGVKAISSRRGIVLVSMETIGMWQQVGFLSDVFEIFKKRGLSIDLIGSSEANVTVSLDPSDNLVNSNVLDALCVDLAEICRVKVIAPTSAITLVGRGIRSLLHKLTDVWSEFGRERVHLISQSSNDLNLTFVVDEGLVDGMMPRLHDLLVHSGAMPVDATDVFGPSWKQIDAIERPRRTPWWRTERSRLLAMATPGAPRYVYHLPTVRARAKSLADVGAVDRRFFALKANSHPAILKAIEAEGFGFECVSQGEIDHLYSIFPGMDPTRVLFTPSFAPRDEFAAAMARDVWVTLDSVYPLQHWPELFANRQIALRIDPGYGLGHHEKVRTGGKEAKFGLPAEAVPEFCAAAKAINAKIVLLHAHVGSGIQDVTHWPQVYAQLVNLAEQIGTVSAIDVGGGIGVPYSPDTEDFDIPAFAKAMAGIKAAWPQYALWIEPGRYLVAESGVLLATVTQVIDKLGVRRIGLDAGMNALMRPALYNAWHEIVNLSRIEDADGKPAEIVGPICESSDVLGKRRALPAATVEGDVALVATAGAYGFVMANRYNLRDLPAEEVLDV